MECSSLVPPLGPIDVDGEDNASRQTQLAGSDWARSTHEDFMRIAQGRHAALKRAWGQAASEPGPLCQQGSWASRDAAVWSSDLSNQVDGAGGIQTPLWSSDYHSQASAAMSGLCHSFGDGLDLGQQPLQPRSKRLRAALDLHHSEVDEQPGGFEAQNLSRDMEVMPRTLGDITAADVSQPPPLTLTPERLAHRIRDLQQKKGQGEYQKYRRWYPGAGPAPGTPNPLAQQLLAKRAWKWHVDDWFYQVKQIVAMGA